MSSTVLYPGDALSRRRRVLTVIVLGLLVGLGPFTIDLYLPAFPAVRAEFVTSEVAVQFTLAGTIVGFALGQLLVGPWSDRVGRKLPLLITTTVHVGACVAAAFAPDVTVLGLFRILQGMGAAGGGVVAMAMVRDLFGGLSLVRMLARLALVTGLAPVLAPVIGSQLLLVLDWRGLFVGLAVYGAVVLTAVVLLIDETRPRARATDPGHSTVRERYRSVLTDRVFLGVALTSAMQFAGLFAYLSSSSFLFQEVHGFDAQQYGLLFAVNSLGIVVGNQISARVMRRIGPQWILTMTTATQFVSAVTIIVVSAAGAPLPFLLVPLFCFITACGFGFPCVQVLALVNHGHEAGTAASLLGAANFGVAGLIAPVVGALGLATAGPMGLVMAVTAAIGILSIWFVVRPRRVAALAR